MPKHLPLYALAVVLLLTAACTAASADVDDLELRNSNTTVQASALLGDCDSNKAAVSSYLFTERIKLWQYTSTTHWCYDGSRITSEPTFTTEAKIYGIANHFMATKAASIPQSQAAWEN